MDPVPESLHVERDYIPHYTQLTRPLPFGHPRGRGGGREEVGCIEARDQSSSRPLTMTVSKSTLGLERGERDSIVGCSPSSSPPASMLKSTSHRKSPIHMKMDRRSSSPGHPRRGKARTERTNRPVRRRSLQGCSSVEVVSEMRTRLGLGWVIRRGQRI